jgi:geranylgeranyl pyrophosphate synthase
VTSGAPLEAYLAALRRDVDEALARALIALAATPRAPGATRDTAPTLITDAMRYSLLGGGKRLRPCLTLATAEATGEAMRISAETAHALALPAGVAVEMIHTYSLIHDDLPAMDDDAWRRGRPTSHVVHGDGLAILAGDGLLTEAFAVLARAPSPAARDGDPEAPVDRRLAAIALLAHAAGAAGMVGGQAIDLAAAGRLPAGPAPIADEAALADMHSRKTGALIRAAATMGAVVVGGPPDLVAAVDIYARELGLAFQIIDDVLDIEGSTDALGKTAGKDAAAGKPTYPAFFGVHESRRLAAGCVARARDALARARLGGRLADLADWSLTRQA